VFFYANMIFIWETCSYAIKYINAFFERISFVVSFMSNKKKNMRDINFFLLQIGSLKA